MAEPNPDAGPANAAESGDLSQLTESQRAAVDQFIAVTAQSVEQAVPLLRRSQWSVEIAIAKFFDGETADPVEEARQQQAQVQAREERERRDREQMAAELQPRRRGSSGLSPAPRIVPQPNAAARRPPMLISLFLFPFSLLWRFSNGFISLLYTIFPFLPRLRGTGPTNRARTTKRSQNPRDTAARFIRSFEEEYGNETGLQFFEGGYAQALDLAKKELRFLLVVLQSDEHDDTASFNKETLTSPEVINFIKEHNIIVWGGSVQDSEAYQVSAALNCTKFPFAALITHAPNSPPGASSQGMSVVARVTGPTPPAAFTAKLLAAITTHSEALDRVRSQRAVQAADRAMIDQQNSAYEVSLARDRERARERREAEERRKREEAEAAQRAEEIEMVERKKEAWKQWRASQIPKEEPSAGAVARISIRTPDGQRILRKFEKEAPMEEVYALVECIDVDRNSLPEGLERPEGYEHTYSFRLVSMMPRKVFSPQEGTVGEHLWPSGNLVVEAIDGDEEED